MSDLPQFPRPTEKQARLLWQAVTVLAIGILVGMFGLLLWGISWVTNKLSGVLLPLAFAGILAYLLDPLVDFFHRRGIPRTRSILLVFFLGVMVVLIMLASVVPVLVVEVQDLVDQAPRYLETTRNNLGTWLSKSPVGMKAKHVWDTELSVAAEDWLTKTVPIISAWLMSGLQQVASWASLLAGFALVPVYVFYFLYEKQKIQGRWTAYVPIRESRIKEEVVFVLQEINDCLIVFFRGQVLVALCVGALMTVGFLGMGLHYAVLLGTMAGILGIIPFLGITISLIPALILASIQFGWSGPVMVLVLVGLVQLAEGFVISPKIIGDRVGLHPLTIIVSVMVGSALLGGIVGGVLAIPLTAALRTLMFRYVWKRPVKPGLVLR